MQDNIYVLNARDNKDQNSTLLGIPIGLLWIAVGLLVAM